MTGEIVPYCRAKLAPHQGVAEVEPTRYPKIDVVGAHLSARQKSATNAGGVWIERQGIERRRRAGATRSLLIKLPSWRLETRRLTVAGCLEWSGSLQL
ncbi:hypothetical protein [Mesorhizobium caraganae]|uniref:hypothetical protein n=1 Tax=Mesorhizobium caraganae TaxID=483206 RepID=UPI0017872D10|nr:hypothetical protein [Mesorhizobium caraganae]